MKHPLFLAIKFSQCAKLYFNTNLLPKTTPINEMLNVLQKKISKDHTSRRSTKNQTKIDDKMFILTISESADSYKNKKVQESIDPLECSSLGIIYNSDELPPFFENITKMVSIVSDSGQPLQRLPRGVLPALPDRQEHHQYRQRGLQGRQR